jgi:hypothetical protein
MTHSQKCCGLPTEHNPSREQEWSELALLPPLLPFC